MVLSEQVVQRLNMGTITKTLLLLHMGEHMLANQATLACTLYQALPYGLACRYAHSRRLTLVSLGTL